VIHPFASTWPPALLVYEGPSIPPLHEVRYAHDKRYTGHNEGKMSSNPKKIYIRIREPNLATGGSLFVLQWRYATSTQKSHFATSFVAFASMLACRAQQYRSLLGGHP